MRRKKSKTISKKQAGEMQRELEEKRNRLKELVMRLGTRFHGSGEKTLEGIRKKGLKREKSKDGFVTLSDAVIADANVYSRGREYSVIHSVPEDYMEEERKKGKIIGTDYYAGHSEKHLFFDVPPERIKTFVEKVEREGNFKKDPLLSFVEKQLRKEGKTMKQEFREHPSKLYHDINYYSLLLAEEDYEKHHKELEKHVKKTLKEKGRVTFTDVRKKARELGILPELQDYVIGSVFLDLGLKKTRKGFVRRA